MTIILYRKYSLFICTLLFGLSEPSKITFLKRAKKGIFHDSGPNFLFELIIKKKITVDDSYRPNKIVQMNVLQAIYSVKVILNI